MTKKYSYNEYIQILNEKLFGKTRRNIKIAMAIKTAGHVYNRYFSDIARRCHGNKECIKRAKNQDLVKGIDAQINTLRRSLAQCNYTNNPSKCVSKIQYKIKKLLTKKSKL